MAVAQLSCWKDITVKISATWSSLWIADVPTCQRHFTGTPFRLAISLGCFLFFWQSCWLLFSFPSCVNFPLAAVTVSCCEESSSLRENMKLTSEKVEAFSSSRSLRTLRCSLKLKEMEAEVWQKLKFWEEMDWLYHKAVQLWRVALTWVWLSSLCGQSIAMCGVRGFCLVFFFLTIKNPLKLLLKHHSGWWKDIPVLSLKFFSTILENLYYAFSLYVGRRFLSISSCSLFLQQ